MAHHAGSKSLLSHSAQTVQVRKIIMRGPMRVELLVLVVILFVLTPYLISSSDPTPSKENEADQNHSAPTDLLNSKQVDKLSLEIESLRKQNKLMPWTQFAPLIVAGLGLAGLAFTIYQFQSGQKKDRMTRELDQRTRLQSQIRTDIDHILSFTSDKKQTVSRVSFLLGDMKTVLESRVDERHKVSDVFPHYERSLTQSLVKLVRDDCDFTKNDRDVGLANTIIFYWTDYSDYLKSDLKKLHFILYAYVRALLGLRHKNPGYLEGLRMNPETDAYEVAAAYEEQENEAILYNKFIDIRDGFLKHLELLGKDTLTEDAKLLKKTITREFREALSNDEISRDILGT